MWYGFTRQRFIQSFVVFTIIGLLGALLGVIGSKVSGTGIQNYWTLTWLILGIPALWLVLASIFTITWLKVEHSDIEWCLWKKVLILKCPIQSVLEIAPGLASAVIIKTPQGTIRLFGLHLVDRLELTRRLVEINPRIKFPSTWERQMEELLR